ncbi:MAG: HipA domain-containing protein [Vitreoscilla sp.]|nr:HipA domain-containing protein [Vitreoscilla sp.]
MPPDHSPDAALLLDALRRDGPLTAAELARRFGMSQPTLWRRLNALLPEITVLGQGRATRYGVPQPILGWPARQPMTWVHADGRAETWGELQALASGRLHVAGPGIDLVADGLPWFLSPLRPQGFLGRLLAQRLAAHGLGTHPEGWTTLQVLFAALQLPDPPGALRLGMADSGHILPLDDARAFDNAAADVAAALPAGSSAGGEQPKFLGRLPGGEDVLVKFSPPRGTPFGERWGDLLRAEHLALGVLAEHGVDVAGSQWMQTPQRSYLVSHRFDRHGPRGRRHVVALDAFHQAFVGGPRQNWAASCTALARQRRVPPEAPSQAQALLQFGRLIGNTDMHFGNLSLWVEPHDVAPGRGRLAPVYDMLPMRWRPDATTGALDLAPFEPREEDLHSAARPLAHMFWARLAGDPLTGRAFRNLAEQMAQRV